MRFGMPLNRVFLMFNLPLLFLTCCTFLSALAYGTQLDQIALKQVLNLTQKHFSFSMSYLSEVECKDELAEEVETIVQYALESHFTDPEIVTTCLRILYTQGNYYLYKERSIRAQEKLLKALEVYEKHYLQSKELSIDQICKSLHAIDPRLPAFYAMTLHLLGKAFLYPQDLLNENEKLRALDYIVRSIQLQEYLENHKQYLTTIDQNLAVGNALIYERVLGYFYFQNHELEKAERLFNDLIQKSTDEFNELLCLKYLVQIYQNYGKSSGTSKDFFYKKAVEASLRMMNLLENFDQIFRISVYYCLLGNLFADIDNPYRETTIAREFFKKAKHSCNANLPFLQNCLHKSLQQFYLILASEEKTLAADSKSLYLENNSTDHLNLFPLKQNLAYEQLADSYILKHDFITSIGLYGNSLNQRTVSENDIKRVFEKRYFAAQKLDPFLTLESYKKLHEKYKSRLKSIRESVFLNNRNQPVAHIYQKISDSFIELMKEMVIDLSTSLPLPHKNFMFISGGSLARSMMTPYSDIELALLIDKQTSEFDKKRFTHFFYTLVFHLTDLGETPLNYLNIPMLNDPLTSSPRGFMLDPGLLSPLKLIVCTPQELVGEILNPSENESPHLRLTFLNYKAIVGSPTLLQEYQERLNLKKDMLKPLIFETLLKDLKRWYPKFFCENGNLYHSIKHDLYRPLISLVDSLSLLSGNYGPQNPWKIINSMNSNHIIAKDLYVKLLSILNDTAWLRLKVYQENKAQNESILASQSGAIQRILSKAQYELYLIQNLFLKHFFLKSSPSPLSLPKRNSHFDLLANSYLNNKGWIFGKNVPRDYHPLEVGMQYLFKGSFQKANSTFEHFYNTSQMPLCRGIACKFLGICALSENHFHKAAIWLRQALKLIKINENFNLLNSECRLLLGLALVKKGKVLQGMDTLNKSLENDRAFFGFNHPQIAQNYAYIASAFQAMDHPLAAIHYLNLAIAIDQKMYGKEHLRLASYYKKLATSWYRINNLTEAEINFKKALSIHSRFLKRTHAILKNDQACLKLCQLPVDEDFLIVEKLARQKPFLKDPITKKFLKALYYFQLPQRKAPLNEIKKQIYTEMSLLIYASYYILTQGIFTQLAPTPRLNNLKRRPKGM